MEYGSKTLIEKMLPEIGYSDDVFKVSIHPSYVAINEIMIRRAIGYSDNNLNNHFSKEITHVLSRMEHFFTIQAGYKIFDISFSTERSDGYTIGTCFFTTDHSIAKQLRYSEKTAVFVCTIGSDMETWSRRMFQEGDPVTGHFIDLAASLAVEQVAEMVHNHIGEIMSKRGYKISNRFSPGYCGWPIHEQQQLFSLLPHAFCGITLNESSLMIPVKSVSGIIGIGKKITREAYPCKRCSNKTCTYRAHKKIRSHTVVKNRT